MPSAANGRDPRETQHTGARPASGPAGRRGRGWALKLTGEAGFIVALVVGLVVGNFFPRLASALRETTRPELYIKTAIVILGGGLGVVAAEQLGLATGSACPRRRRRW